MRMGSAESLFAKAPQAANTAAAIKTVLLMIIFSSFLLLSHYSPLAAKSYTTGAIIPHKTPNAPDVLNFAAIVFRAKTFHLSERSLDSAVPSILRRFRKANCATRFLRLIYWLPHPLSFHQQKAKCCPTHKEVLRPKVPTDTAFQAS